MAQKWSEVRKTLSPEAEERIRQKVDAKGVTLNQLPEARRLTRVLAEATAHAHADADPRQLTTATLALAEAQHRLGIMSDADYQKIVRGHAKMVRAMK